MPRPLLSWLAVSVLALLAGSLAAAEDDDQRTPLEVRKKDIVHLKDGQKIEGMKIDDLPDNGVTIKNVGKIAINIPGDQIQEIEYHQSAADAVSNRGREDIRASDWSDLQKTLEWGLKNNARDAVLTTAHDAIATAHNADLAASIVPLLINADDAQAALDLVTGLLAKDKSWTEGYELEAQALVKLGKRQELERLIGDWLNVEPTAATPLRYRAAGAEQAGDLRTAHEDYRKLADLHHDDASAIGQARTALRLGNSAETLQTAEALIARNVLVDEARALAGAALLTEGDEAKAQPLLAQAATGKLADATAAWVHYDLGLIAYHQGHADEARSQWKDLTLPAAQLGLAMLDRRPVNTAEMPPELVPIASEYDASLALENRQFDAARPLVEQVTGPRQAFLEQLVGLRAASVDAVRALAETRTPESLRWQAFGYLGIRRWADAEAVLAQLPENDGYAAVCRVYLASARRDELTARALFERAKRLPDVPVGYMMELTRYYEGRPRALEEEFAVPVTELAKNEWTVLSAGTGIDVTTADHHLVFDGTQAQTSDPLCALLRVAPYPGFRFAMAMFDTSGLGNGIGGLVVIDHARANGVAFAVTGDSHLGWRLLTDGSWGPWKTLDQQAHTTQELRIDVDHGAVTLRSRDPLIALTVVRGLFKDEHEVVVGPFGTAEPGTHWTLKVSEFREEWLTDDVHQHR